MLRYMFDEPIFIKIQKGHTREKEITDRMADWYAFQLRNDLTVARGGAITCKGDIMHEGLLPESLKGSDVGKPTLEECNLFITVADVFIKYINKFRKETVDITQLKIAIGAVEDTRFKVEGECVIMFSDDVELVDTVRDAVVAKGFIFDYVSKKEVEERWSRPSYY